MPRRNKLPHPRQILTTKRTIVDFLWEITAHIDDGLAYCIANGPDDPNYLPTLYGVCVKLAFAGRLVYKSKNGITKLPVKTYDEYLFISEMETKEEVAHIFGRLGLDLDRADYVFQCLQPIKQLICHMISRRSEQVYTSELAYAVDYVVRRKGEVEVPVFQSPASPFPSNYEDFHYTEGIAKEIENIEIWWRSGAK